MAAHMNNFPKLHNAAWPGLVGKGPDSGPPLDLDTMINHTANAQVDGVRFDGMDLFLVAPVWPPTGGGSAMGSESDRKNFVTAVKKACRIGKKLRELGARPYGVVRI